MGNPQTGGYGITLTQANTVIYYSNGYDLEKRLQSEDRAHRIGQKKSVTYVDFIAQKTVDEKIVKALRKKIDIASEILGEELRDWILMFEKVIIITLLYLTTLGDIKQQSF